MAGQTVRAKLLQSMQTSGDVTFLVGPRGSEEIIKSSTFLLSSLSSVFAKMFTEAWNSQNDVVRLPDIKPKVFRLFLQLLLIDYPRVDHDGTHTMEQVLNLLYTARKFDVSSIQTACRSSIKEMITTRDENPVFAYNQLLAMNEHEAADSVLDYIIQNMDDILDEDFIDDLSKDTWTKILNSKALDINELSLFKGLVRWGEIQCEEEDIPVSGINIRNTLGDLLFLNRIPVMTLKDFFETVEPMKILTPEEVTQVSRYLVLKGDPKIANCSPFKLYRGYM